MAAATHLHPDLHPETDAGTCGPCALGLHHCHALLVEHDDGTATCLDGCGGPRAVHDEAIACAEVGMGCCGAADEAARLVPEEVAWAARTSWAA